MDGPARHLGVIRMIINCTAVVAAFGAGAFASPIDYDVHVILPNIANCITDSACGPKNMGIDADPSTDRFSQIYLAQEQMSQSLTS